MAERVIPYAGWAYLRNIGDMIGADVIEHVSGAKPVLSDRKANHVLTVGSILFLSNHNSYIWGSGSLGATLPGTSIDATRICALRGKLTADLLTRSGYTVPDVPFGDPGIFIPDIFPAQTVAIPHAKKIVFVPHHSNYLRYVKYLKWPQDIEILDVATGASNIIAKIASADIVLSESLHGLIFGIAYGKKVTWVGNEKSDNFKYMDWFSTTDHPQMRPYAHSEGPDTLIAKAVQVSLEINKQDLIASFPKHLIYSRHEAGRVPYNKSRDHEFYMASVSRQELGIPKYAELSPDLLYREARTYVENVFRHWDEPVYAIISVTGEGAIPGRHQALEILYELDHHIGHGYGVIIEKTFAERRGLQSAQCGKNLWAYHDRVGFCGTVVIRPQYEKRDNYAVFCV